jgi:general L-amino acid transport system substrate-binding protein
MSALTGCLPTSDSAGVSSSKLQAVMARGKLNCGVSGELPGFSFVNPNGDYSGLDVDFCRAIAAALFDDPEAVNYRRLNAKERFTALQTGEIDVLSRNTTWTLSRDGANRMAFTPVVFYDGQGMMVRQASGIKTLKDFAGQSICTQTGTTNEQNLSDQMRKLGVNYTPVVFEDINAVYKAYAEDRCQGVTSDRSQLLSRRSAFPKPEEHVILEEVMSKEPLTPAVSDGDAQWLDAVSWVIYSTIEAEDLGIRSGNLDQFLGSEDPVIRRFLGKEDNLGAGIGLPNDFALRVVKHVGNYAQIYDRNLGPKTKLNLPRGQNKLWKDGGLLYSPPFR